VGDRCGNVQALVVDCQVLAELLVWSDGYTVYPVFIEDDSHLLSKTYMTRIEGENTRLRHYLIAPQDVVLLKSIEMLECSLRLLLHYLKDGTVHIPLIITFQQRRAT